MWVSSHLHRIERGRAQVRPRARRADGRSGRPRARRPQPPRALHSPRRPRLPGPRGRLYDDSALRRRYYAALRAADIEHLRFHDLRHTFGTLAVQEFALSDVKAYMGHADIATTMIYVHHVPQHDAADRVSRRLAKASTAAAVLDAAESSPAP
ncbi:MAG: tyrosine-type recombinase/integrase [Solirubrobacteraceae bacterium]